MMDQPFATQAPADARGIQQIHSALFEHARADALFYVLPSVSLDDDGLDAFQVEQVRQQKTSGSCANDADFCMQRRHGSALHDTIVRMKEYPRPQPGTQPEYLYEG